MIINLFSIFDPSTNIFNLNWISILICIFILPLNYWITNSRLRIIFKFLNNFLKNELRNNMHQNYFKTIYIFQSLFILIFFNNLFGLFPYIFTATRHIIITLTLAIPIWIIFLLYGWIKKTNKIFSHLVPNGTPIILSSFIVLIETTRNIIRPITLSVRLAANIIAGHLLISLLRGIRENFPILYIPTRNIIIILISLEYAVAIIQRYVFITLISLYINEIK